jgi:hypothetical protein
MYANRQCLTKSIDIYSCGRAVDSLNIKNQKIKMSNVDTQSPYKKKKKIKKDNITGVKIYLRLVLLLIQSKNLIYLCIISR